MSHVTCWQKFGWGGVFILYIYIYILVYCLHLSNRGNIFRKICQLINLIPTCRCIILLNENFKGTSSLCHASHIDIHFREFILYWQHIWFLIIFLQKKQSLRCFDWRNICIVINWITTYCRLFIPALFSLSR